MKRFIFMVAAIIVCFLLQCTVFEALQIGFISPNLLIILTASIGFMRGKKEGLLLGFFSGLLLDIMAGEFLGVYAMIYMLIGYCNGFFQNYYFPENVRLPVFAISVSDLISSMAIYLGMFFLRGRFHFAFYLWHTILPELIYTMVIALLLYPVLYFINSRLEEDEKRSKAKFV